MAIAKTELEDLVKASQDAEKKIPKKEPAAEAPKADSKRQEVEDKIAKDNAEPAKVTTDTKQYKIDKLEKEIKDSEEENKKLLSDPSLQAALKTNDEKKAKIDKAREELKAIDREKDSTSYDAKMKEIQDLNQDLNDFQDKWSKDNQNLEDKAKEIKDKIGQLKKELEAAKEEAKKASNESLTMLKSFKDFVAEKNKS
jgi:chromosome segregation ATPase